MATRLRRMLRLKGTRCLVDERGNPRTVQIDLKKRDNLWEDVLDVIIAQGRRQEPRTTLFESKTLRKGKGIVWTPKVVIAHSAHRELKSLTRTGADRVMEAIRDLQGKAWPPSEKKAHKLVPGEFTYRKRASAFRIVYEVYLDLGGDPVDGELIVFV